MNNVSIERGYEVREPQSASRDEIEGNCDVEALREMYLASDERELEMHSFLDAFRAAEINDDQWFRRTAGALAYCKISKRWIERRILTLGGEVPYFPTDPRSRALRILNEKLEKLTKRVRELEYQPGEGE